MLRNNWESKEELVSLTLAPRANRLDLELPVMVGCYQYHLLINGVSFCDRGRPYRWCDSSKLNQTYIYRYNIYNIFRYNNEGFGDFVNFLTLWSDEPPFADWPGVQVTTKLDFPLKVQLVGSWGEQVNNVKNPP